MISCIVFSKNRPLQLDLCLKSIRQNLPLVDDIAVIHKYDEEYLESLQILRYEHRNVYFRDQEDLVSDLRSCISLAEYVCLMTDDDVVYQPLTKLPNLENTILHLRLGRNITHRDYGRGLEWSIQPPLKEVEGFLEWDRMKLPLHDYFNYPLSLDGNIYEKSLLSFILDLSSKNIHTPNQLESDWQSKNNLVVKRYLCPLESVVVNSPNNRVQTEFANKAGESYALDPILLNKVYLLGKRINLSKIKFPTISCPHTELDILEGLE